MQREGLWRALGTPCLSFMWVFLCFSSSQAPMALGCHTQAVPPDASIKRMGTRACKGGREQGVTGDVSLPPGVITPCFYVKIGAQELACWMRPHRGPQGHVGFPTLASPRTSALLTPAAPPLFLGLSMWWGRGGWWG